MSVTDEQNVEVPIEQLNAHGRLVITDGGKVAVIAQVGEDWWIETGSGYDRVAAMVTMEELRARAGAIHAALEQKGIPYDVITAFVLAVIADDSPAWDGNYAADDFRRAVIGFGPLVLADPGIVAMLRGASSVTSSATAETEEPIRSQPRER